MEHERGGGDLDVLAGLERGQHTGCDTVRDTVLVLLEVHLLHGLGGLVLLGDLGALAGGGLLGVARCFGCGNHSCDMCMRLGWWWVVLRTVSRED